MKKNRIAIIAPCILPVPATKGGAVEELITCIFNQNETSKCYSIDLFTIGDSSYNLTSSCYSNLISIPRDNYTKIIDKVADKYYRTFGTNRGVRRVFDKQIIDEFIKRANSLDEGYYAVIIENQMSLVMELLESNSPRRDFPIYFHMHNDVDIYRSPFYIDYLTKNGVQFIAVSEYIKNQILRYSKNAIVHVLYNGVAFENYSKTTKVPDDKVRFLYAGRIIPDKGVLELVEAFIRLYKIIPESYRDRISLDIVGFSDKPYKYEKDVVEKARPYSDIISCQKRLSTTEMSEKYNDYDVVVMPTFNEEPFGLVALETIAKGIPLITTNSGAIPEVVEDGAIIVDKNSNLVQELADAMLDLAIDNSKREALGKKAYSLARTHVEFDINTYYDRLVSIFDYQTLENTISIVVPVYNVEKLLGRCVDSLINQTYKNLEIILVDDGSTDNSSVLCDEYANLDSRIKVVHQKNAGLSGARNTGIDMSTGGYIFFVDSDDYLAEDAMEKMLAQLKRTHSDVVACGISYVFDDKPEEPFTNDTSGSWSGAEGVLQMMQTNNICTVAWNKLSRRSLWDGVRFPVGKVHEDEATTYKILYKSRLVTYMPEPFYKYYQRSDSIMRASVVSRCEDYFEAIENRINYFDFHHEDELKDYSRVVLLDHYKYVYRNSDNDAIKKDLVKRFREEIHNRKLPAYIGLGKRIGLLLWQFYQY